MRRRDTCEYREVDMFPDVFNLTGDEDKRRERRTTRAWAEWEDRESERVEYEREREIERVTPRLF